MHVFVLDDNRKPPGPCTPARARILLAKGRAAVFRRFPFTIILNERRAETTPVHQHRIKTGPGSRTAGVAIVPEATGFAPPHGSTRGLPQIRKEVFGVG